MVDKRDKSQRVVVASESRGERSCLFILRRSRHPECPVGPKSCRDLAETALPPLPGRSRHPNLPPGPIPWSDLTFRRHVRTQEDAGTPRGPSGEQFAGQHSSAAPRHPVACSALPLINQQFKGIIYLLSTETP